MTEHMDEAADLINALLDGRLTSEEAARLESLVREHPDVAKLYVRYLHQECVMMPHTPTVVATDLNLLNTFDRDEPERRRQHALRRWWAGMAGAAAAVLVLGVVWSMFSRDAAVPERRVVAIVDEINDANFAGKNAPASRGDAVLAAMPMELKSGAIELAFNSGTHVSIEGPARFTADAAGQLTLTTGRLTARVPPQAIGFRVNTPSGAVVDLGTEFGVSIRPDGSVDVDVFVGKVRAEPYAAGSRSKAVREVNAGQSVQLDTRSVTFGPPPTKPTDFDHRAPAVRQANVEPVNLFGSFDRVGITADDQPIPGDGIDGRGKTYSASQLSPLEREFVLGPPGANNAVTASGQFIALPAGQFRALTMLGAAINGKKPDELFTVEYTDGSTQSFKRSLSNWNTQSHFPDETLALAMPYRNDNLSPAKKGDAFAYRYTLDLDPSKTVRRISLPKDARLVVILAMNLQR